MAPSSSSSSVSSSDFVDSVDNGYSARNSRALSKVARNLAQELGFLDRNFLPFFRLLASFSLASSHTVALTRTGKSALHLISVPLLNVLVLSFADKRAYPISRFAALNSVDPERRKRLGEREESTYSLANDEWNTHALEGDEGRGRVRRFDRHYPLLFGAVYVPVVILNFSHLLAIHLDFPPFTSRASRYEFPICCALHFAPASRLISYRQF